MTDTSAPDMTIKVTGYQWKWNYDYLQEGFAFYSNLSTPLAQIENRDKKGPNYLLEVDKPMVVPIGAKVRVIITAGDVLHSWSVPAFGVKQDAIPGFVRDSWFKAEKIGTYRGQCSELCGKEHGFMPVVVEVKSKDDYAAWVADRKKETAAAAEDPGKVWTEADLAAKGHTVFDANCAACHQANGKGVPGTFPALDGSKVVTGPADAQIALVHRHAAVEAAFQHRHRSRHHLHAQRLGQPFGRGGTTGSHSRRPQMRRFSQAVSTLNRRALPALRR
jgi:cytochrome c oxidase subunit II